MCRSIKVLRVKEKPATPEEVNAAALQFVRKISGRTKPSKAHQEIFDRAVAEIAETSRRLLAEWDEHSRERHAAEPAGSVEK